MAEDPKPVTGTSSPLAGEVDTANHYSSTIRITPSPLVSEDPGRQCSGVLIGPRLVLTAGHCVCMRRKATTPGDEDEIIIDSSACATKATVTTVAYDPPAPGEGLGSLAREYSGRIRPHPELKILLDGQENVVSSNADLAVILLDRPVKGNFPPARLTETEIEADESIVMVGYGRDGNRRFTKNQVMTVLGSGGGRILFQQPKRHTYKGDSGGPCLREAEQGSSLVGISNRGLGKEPTFTSTYFYRPWLREELQRAATAGPAPQGSP